MSDYLLRKKRLKHYDKEIINLEQQIDQLMEQYISSEDIYGDQELYLKISKLEQEKKKLIKTRQSFMKKSNVYDGSKVFADASIVIDEVSFDITDASFRISYRRGGKRYYRTIPICKNDMNKSSFVSKEIIDQYGKDSLKAIDINLYSALSKFDGEMGTNYARGYAINENDFPVKYHFDDFYQSHSGLSILDKLKIRENAKRNDNSISKTGAKYLAPAIVSLAIFVGAFGAIKNHSDSLTIHHQTSIEKESDDMSSSQNDMELNETNYQHIISAEAVQEEDKSDYESDSYSASRKRKEFKVNSKYYLDSVDLSFSSTEDQPAVNTDELDYDYYKPTLISVRDNDGIKKNKDVKDLKGSTLSDVVDKYIEKYGEDISVSINFDGYDKEQGKVSKNIGWADLVDLYVDKEKTNQDKIDNLKELKSTLQSDSSDKARVKTYKKI